MSSHHGRITSEIDNSYLIEQVHKYPETIPMHVVPEPRTCSHFGCGKTLSLTEALCGDRCIDHQGRKGVEIMTVLKMK